MKTIITILKNSTTAGVITLFALFFGAQTASAATFNTHSADFDTLRVGNYSDAPNSNSAQWTTSTSADAGETINFAIYYHNTSSETAKNVRVRLSPQTTNTGTTHGFTATVWADNASSVSGNATVHLSSSQKISYNNNTVWRPNQMASGSAPLLFGQNGSEIFTSAGLRLGDINPDSTNGSTQGNVMISFKVSNSSPTPSGSKPSVTTNSPSNISQNSATLRGSVTTNNSSTQVWFEWGTSSSLGNSTSHDNRGTTNGSWSRSIGALSSNTVYYYRAVAQNAHGTDYGSIVSFVTDNNSNTGNRPSVTTNSPSNIFENGATLSGFVDTNNSNTQVWFEWGTSSSLGNSTSRDNRGTTNGSWNTTISGLSYNTVYYYRAVAENSYGTSYGNIVSFVTQNNTNNTGNRPAVTTNSPSEIFQNSAILRGFVSTNNSNTQVWFEWGVSSSLNNSTSRDNRGTTDGSWGTAIGGLSPNTIYYYRAVAQNSYGTSYGNTISFVTQNGNVISNPTNNVPGVLTTGATPVTETTAQLNGSLFSNDSNTNVTGWFEWGATPSLGSKTGDGFIGTASNISFKNTIAGLSPNTVYYYRAVAQNAYGTGYGNVLSFRTGGFTIAPPLPPVNPPIVITPVAPARSVSIVKSVENLTAANGSARRVFARRGDLVRFTIEAENTGTLAIRDLEIKDRVPEHLEFANANERNDNNPRREVVWFVGDMEPGDIETVTLDMIVTQDAPIGADIENTARIVSPSLTKTSNTVEISVDESRGNRSLQGAAAFFGFDGVFPTTLIGWLLLILILLLLVFAGRKVYEPRT